MNTNLPGRLLLSLVLVATIIAEIGFTWFGWTGEHIFNPDWHPHARFHAAQMVGFIVVMSLGGLWLVWRRSREPHIATSMVAGAGVCYWGGEFFAFFIPGTSPSPIVAEPNTFQLFGSEVYGNLFFSGLLIALSALGGLLAYRSELPRRSNSLVG